MIVVKIMALLVKISFVLGCVFLPLFLAVEIHPLFILLWFLSPPLAVWTTEW